MQIEICSKLFVVQNSTTLVILRKIIHAINNVLRQETF
jgi:hypothetical protein